MASGINNAVARTAGMLAVALLGALAVSLFRSDLDRRLAPLPLAAEMRQAIAAEVPRLAEAEVPPAIQGAQRQTVEQALRQSFIASYRIVTLICAGLAALGALAALLFVRA